MPKKRKIPHTYVIVFFIIVFSALLTWVIPGGSFERKTINVNGTNREVIVDKSFKFDESNPQATEIFSAFFDGFVGASDIIVFILMIGGAFWIMNESKAINVGIFSFLKYTKGLEKYKFAQKLGVENIIITLIMLMFSLFGAAFGMSEETIAFVVIFIPLSISMGYDSIVGVSMCFVAAALGFAGALLNPFTIGIAQGLAELPLYSGIEYRFVSWVVINLVGITYVIRYAKKIKKDPKKSPVYSEDEYWRNKGNSDIENIKYHTPKSAWITYVFIGLLFTIYSIKEPIVKLSIGNASVDWPIFPILTLLFIVLGLLSLRKSVHFFILNLLMFTILLLLVGVMGYGWYVKEIASLFLAMGIFSAAAMNYSPNRTVLSFLEGAKDIIAAALIVGLAKGIIVILQDGNIIDTLLYYASNSMSNLGKTSSVVVMYLFQTLLNVAIPSGSGQAALTMPIMSQFSDIVGISRQTTVMVFQFGDGFTNMITPTSGVLIGVLGVARIPYEKWVKWMFPFLIILVILGLLLLIPTITMDLKGF